MAEYQTMRTGTGTRTAQIDEGLRAHMNKVYGIMSVGMLITAAAAWAISGLALSPVPTGAQIGADTYLTDFGVLLYTSPLKWVVMFAPLAMVFAMGAMINKLSVAGAQTFFYAFAALMGLSLSWIFAVYTGFSIIQVFLITAVSFAGLSLYGYTTKKDISGWGSFLIMGVIGLIIASVINIFLGSGTMSLVISFLGVLIFAGLTAYDTQRLKNEYSYYRGTEWAGKAIVLGALSLYLDFINMFLFLLRFMGSRD